jgi:hypothetical protein
MKMKRLFLLSGFLFAFSSMHAQEADQRLYKSYSTSDIEQIKSEKPESIRMLNYALENACYLAPIPEGKDFGNLPEIKISNLSNLPSFAELGLKIEKSNQYFRVSGSQQLLVVKSEWVLNYEMEKH